MPQSPMANLLTRRVQRHILWATDSGPLVSWLSSATPPPNAGIQFLETQDDLGFDRKVTVAAQPSVSVL